MDQTSTPAMSAGATSSDQGTLPAEAATELRRLSHDLSNALEIVVQTSYLLSLAELKDPAAEWVRMLDSGVSKALALNQEIRTYVRDHSPK